MPTQINLFAQMIWPPPGKLVNVIDIPDRGVDNVGAENTTAPIISMMQQGETMRDVAHPEVTDVDTYVNPFATGNNATSITGTDCIPDQINRLAYRNSEVSEYWE